MSFMYLSSPRRWLAAVLLMAVLVPETLPLGAAARRCAHGMAAGCCCLRNAAMKPMKAGDHCSLRRAASSCALRPAGDQAAEILPGKDRPGRIGVSLVDHLRLPRAASRTFAALDASAPELSRPAPPTPPPRPVPAA